MVRRKQAALRAKAKLAKPDQLGDLDVQKRLLEIEILRTDRFQKRYLWPVTNISGLITVGTLIYANVFAPIQQLRLEKEKAQRQEAKAIKKADRAEGTVKEQSEVLREVHIPPNSSENLDLAGKRSDVLTPPTKVAPAAPKTQIEKWVDNMFASDRGAGKRALNFLINGHQEDPGLTSAVTSAATAPVNKSNYPGLINGIDCLMYIPRYRLLPDISKVEGMVRYLSALPASPIARDQTRFRYDLQLLKDRLERIRKTGRG